MRRERRVRGGRERKEERGQGNGREALLGYLFRGPRVHSYATVYNHYWLPILKELCTTVESHV